MQRLTRCWKQPEARRAFMDMLKVRFGVGDDGRGWQAVTSAMVRAEGGSGLLARHGNSMYRLLADTYPELQLEEEQCRRKVGQAHWQCSSNRRRFLLRLGKQLGYESAEEWAKLTTAQVRGNRGAGLLRMYGDSVAKMVADVLPEVGEEAVHGLHAHRGYWDKKEHQKRLVERVAEMRGVGAGGDWRQVTRNDVVAAGGGALLSRFSSVAELIAALRHHVDGGRVGNEVGVEPLWRPRVPASYWHSGEKLRAYFNAVGPALGVGQPEDWERVSVTQLKEVPGGSALCREHSLPAALALAYPGRRWERQSHPKAAQRVLAQHLTCMVAGQT